MPEIDPLLVLEALATALETTAFVSLEPPAEAVPAPDGAELLALRFHGARNGRLEIAAPRALGALLAANTLALDPESAEALANAQDSLKELCNITAGAVLNRIAEAGGEAPEMELPAAASLAGGAAWDAFVAQPGTTVLLADGIPLAVRWQEEGA